jgi:TPR repeat protein
MLRRSSRRPGRLKCHGDGAKLGADITTGAVPEKAKGDPVLKKMLCAAAIAAAMALPAAEAAQVDAASVEKLKAGAERGDAAAQTALGGCYAAFGLCAGVPRDPAKARLWFEKAAAQGDAEALYNLGVLHAKGRGVPQDPARARALWEEAAAKGHAQAQANLGVMYKDGRGVKKDKAAARQWFGKACGNGFQPGCDQYRRLVESGS